MANLAAGVTAPTGASSAQAEGRAVALHVAKALAMVTLLCFGGARKWAAIGFMARLLAVVAEALSRGANFSEMANVATFKASTTGERRHGDEFVGSIFLA